MRFTALLLSLALVSCAPAASDPVPERRESDIAREASPNVPEGDQAQVVRDNSDFGLALNRAALPADQNGVTSPFSISSPRR